MKGIIYIFAVAVLICACVISSVVVLNQRRTIERIKQGEPELLRQMKWENTVLKEGFFQEFKFEGVTMDYSAVVERADDEESTLQKALEGKNSLVCFVKVGSCRDCVYDNMTFIKTLKKKGVNLLVGIDGLTAKEFKAFVNQYEITNVAYRLPDNRFSSLFEINPVVYFVVDKELNSKFFYTPSVAFSDLTNDYFTTIEELIDIRE